MAFSAIRQRYIIPWTTIDSNTNGIKNQGYFCDSVGGIDVLLPSNPVEGDVFAVCNVSGGFAITQGAGVRIRIQNLVSTPGITGEVASTENGDSVYLVYQASEDMWIQVGSPGGIIDVI